MTESDALAIVWPSSFWIHYADGKRERLLASDGVGILLQADCPLGRGGISAMIEPKHPKHQFRGLRHVYFDEIEAIVNEDGTALWKRRS